MIKEIFKIGQYFRPKFKFQTKIGDKIQPGSEPNLYQNHFEQPQNLSMVSSRGSKRVWRQFKPGFNLTQNMQIHA